MATKTTELKFKVQNVKGTNEDGKDRQELLRYFSEESERNVLQFHRGALLPNNHQVIEIMINGEKIGELDDKDYVDYESTKTSAKEGKLNIFSELLDDGTVEYSAEAILVIPMIISPKERAKILKRKRVVILCLCVFFFVYMIYSIVTKGWGEAAISLGAIALLLYWTFIRDPKKDDAAYQFIEYGKRKKSI